MYNIKKAVSRLNFAPNMKDIQVTDIKKGTGVFTPKPDRPVSFAALKLALKKAGYTLDSARITVSGTVIHDGTGWWIEVQPSKQRFAIEGANLDQSIGGAANGGPVELTGDWQTLGDGTSSREVIRPEIAKKAALTRRENSRSDSTVPLAGIQVSLAGGTEPSPVLAPIRTTSPGLTVFKGGAFVPRYLYSREHLGNLTVNRHVTSLEGTYTPTPTLQIEAEVPYQFLSFNNETASGTDLGFGNITLSGKYRFYRAVQTWGDRQAAVRVGLELPTGNTGAPPVTRLPEPDFVRQQLSPINGGLSLHTEVTYSQAYHRIIFGGDLEGVVRGERDGYRLGHEVSLNTDLEYVLLPREYRSPGKELFAILETSFRYRGVGRSGGVAVPGSTSTEFCLAPGLQFTATPRLVIEGSYQFPAVLNAGPLAMRADRNVLIGIRFLY